VTLIAAFKTYDGAVILADSQETLGIYAPQGFGDYRCRVDKIRPQRAGQYWLVVGGAGDGDLVDGFTERLADEIAAWPAGLDADKVKAEIRSTLLKYNQDEVSAANLTDSKLEFIICVKQLEPGADPLLFRAGKSITRIDGYALIGWEDGIYKHFVDRLYKNQAGSKDTRNRNSGNRALLVGLYVMMLARSTSNVIGPPTVAIHARSSGLVEIPQESVELIEKRLESFARILEDVTLWCPDPDVPNREFPGYLDNIEKQLLDLREQYFGKINRGVVIQPPYILDEEKGDESD
jgi:hypothetical protein